MVGPLALGDDGKCLGEDRRTTGFEPVPPCPQAGQGTPLTWGTEDPQVTAVWFEDVQHTSTQADPGRCSNLLQKH